MEEREIIKKLNKEGYIEVRKIKDKGLCGIMTMAFTTGLFYGLDFDGYKGRYCYQTAAQAFTGLITWDGKGHPKGPWIKHKGKGIDESNPNE